MNHWIKKRNARRLYMVVLTMDGHSSKLEDVRIILRESINSLEFTVDIDKQSDDVLSEFYQILGSVFIDLSSFTEPDEATITVVPNDQTKDAFILIGAIALSTNFNDGDGADYSIGVTFSYRTKKNLPYISI